MNRDAFIAFTSREDIHAEELPQWFETVRDFLQSAYVAAETPWQGSGKSGTFAEWTRLRIPVTELLHKDGSFLDIGCANGFLLQCLEQWAAHIPRQLSLHGLDIGEQLVAAARTRLPHRADYIHVGNGWDWQPPHRYDFVRTELVYVPTPFQNDYVKRLRRDVVAPDGRLIIAHYRGRTEDLSSGWHSEKLQAWGYTISETANGYSKTGQLLAQFYALNQQ